MNFLIRILFIFPVFTAFSQLPEELTSEQRAYLYHIVRKSPILDTNMGRYLDYQGPVIKYINREINFDSIENLIIAQPELLFINRVELARVPKGILSEAVNKMALWELNKTLSAKRSNKPGLEGYEAQYALFETLLIQRLPYKALKDMDGKMLPHPKLQEVLNPQLGFNDKKQLLSTLLFLNQDEQLSTLIALNESVEAFVAQRSRVWFLALGGVSDQFDNRLVAVGDGSPNAGETEDREKDERGRWNRGLPKATGLFPYQAEIKPGDKKTKPEIQTRRFATLDFETAGNMRQTIVHPDVWGYKSGKQTTVVIERNGLSYPLFGTEDSRFLSPDSTFPGGKTFHSLIREMEEDKIAKLDEMISGKRGFDYWIKWNTKKRNETELKIEKHEKSFSDLGYTPISTSDKPSRKVKKDRRKKQKAGNNQPIDYQPTTYANDKKRKGEQQTIVDLYDLYEMYKRKIAELEKQKQEAIDLRATYQRRLDHYREMLGFTWATYTEKDGFYTFQDSCTFDVYTQEFTFPPSREKKPFEIRVLSIPEGALSDVADEVMIHFNVSDAIPGYDARLQVKLEDAFADNDWKLQQAVLQPADSIGMMQVLASLGDKKQKLQLNLLAGGVGKWTGCRVDTLSKPNMLSTYPGGSKDDTTYKRLRYTEALCYLNRGLQVQVSAYTDNIKSGLQVSNADLQKLMNTYKLSSNDLLSAYRAVALLRKLENDLFAVAATKLKPDELKIARSKWNAQVKKAKIQIGKNQVPIKLFI